jgi:hypothetical protein
MVTNPYKNSNNPITGWTYRVVGRDSGIHIGDIRSDKFTTDEIDALYNPSSYVDELNPLKMYWEGKIWLVKDVVVNDNLRVTTLEVFMYNDNPDLTKYTYLDAEKSDYNHIQRKGE